MLDAANATESMSAGLGASHGVNEHAEAHGTYHFVLREYADGPIIHEWDADNVVCTIGKNVMLNAALAGSSYSTVGPFLGLISSVSFSAVSAADTMASHAGWLEAGGAHAPTYSGTRDTATMAAASAGAISLASGAAYTFTGAGTVQGAFLTYGTGAVSTIDSTAGTLYSAGTFGTAQPVISGNVLTVNYTTSL